MKKFKSVFGVSTLTMLLCASASAFAFSTSSVVSHAPGPAAMPGTAQGTLTLTKNGKTLTCNTVFVGTWNMMGPVSLSKVDFGTNAGCADLSTPATSEAPLQGQIKNGVVTLTNAVVNSHGAPICGPGSFSAAVKGASLVYTEGMSTLGDCTVVGTMSLQQNAPLYLSK